MYNVYLDTTVSLGCSYADSDAGCCEDSCDTNTGLECMSFGDIPLTEVIMIATTEIASVA